LLVVRARPAPVSPDKPKQTAESEREVVIRSREQAEEKPRREEMKKKAGAEKNVGEEKNADRQELLRRVLKMRERARADRTADRISGHFFDDGEEGSGDDEVLPSLPASEVESLASRLDRESIQEEREDLQNDPLVVLAQRDQFGRSEVSDVSKVLAVQAGMGAASKGRRLTITSLCVVGVLAVLGGGVYLAVASGWFGGFGSVGKGKSGEGRFRVNVATGEISKEEAQRLRDSLWKVERQSPDGRRIGLPGFDLRQRAGKKTEAEKKLQAFYRAQGKEKRELTPRIPGSVLLPTPTTIDLPTASVSSLDVPLPVGKSEMTPTGPARTSGSGRLSDFQVRVVIQKHYSQVKSCLERQLKRDASISGKMYVVARVSPRGKVGKVRIATAKFNGTFVEECLIKEIRRWDFPAFNGESYDLTFPLLLTARQTY
jgi:hypothetical protein